MDYSRRKFFQFAGTAAAGALVLPYLTGCNDGDKKTEPGDTDTSTTTPPAATASLDQYGLQLWSVRDDMAKDPKGTLKQVASYGYKQIESFEGEKGMFWGMTNKEFKAYMDELGMTIVSSHADTKKDFEKKAAEAAEIGIKYLVTPHIGPQKTMADWKPIVADFNRNGEICKKAGIRYAYHNHAYSFLPVEGQIPQDYMLTNTDPALVDFELDLYWVVTGGKDPIEYLQKYPNRFRLCHVKDRSKTLPATEQNASCVLGTGSIDFPKVLKVAQDNGMLYYIVEHERWDDGTPMECAKADADYMEKLVFA